MWVIVDKCWGLLANTGDLAYIGEPLVIFTASSTLDIGRNRDLSQTSFVLTIKGYLNKASLCLFQN